MAEVGCHFASAFTTYAPILAGFAIASPSHIANEAIGTLIYRDSIKRQQS
jgi:hypothetical protein